MRRLLRSIWREPFAVSFFAGFFGAYLILGESPPLWTLPLYLAGWTATWFADVLWQERLDREGRT